MIIFDCDKEICAGVHVKSAIELALTLANEHNDIVDFIFNETNFYIFPNTTVDENYKIFKDIVDFKHKQWEESEEGQKHKRENEERIAREKRTIRKLLFHPPNFSDENSVFDWLLIVEKCYSTHNYRDDIVALFEKNGFIPNVFCGEEFVEGNRDIEFRWLIGQALDGIKTVGAIHQIFPSFVERFKENFGD